jgi:hypothetical protein
MHESILGEYKEKKLHDSSFLDSRAVAASLETLGTSQVKKINAALTQEYILLEDTWRKFRSLTIKD